MVSVESLCEENLNEAKAFLSEFEDTSQFLVTNLESNGPRLSDHLNSGNFKLIRKNSVVKAVFCLTRRGNLLAQQAEDFSDLVLKSSLEESVTVKGFIGDWLSISPIWQKFKRLNPHFKPSYESKEILYSYLLSPKDDKIKHDPRVRYMRDSDFLSWKDLDQAYLAEVGIPNELTTEQKHKEFQRRIGDQVCWGLFSEGVLLSQALLNSKGKDVGQVGGVFTSKKARRRGLSKATMFHVLKDCRDHHRHRKSLLFTGENDIPAQRLYESMGYQRIGFFAIILG